MNKLLIKQLLIGCVFALPFILPAQNTDKQNPGTFNKSDSVNFYVDSTKNSLSDSTAGFFDFGEIKLSASKGYLPVESFTDIVLHIENIPDTLLSATIEVENPLQARFIKIINSQSNIDSTGTASFTTIIDKPDESLYSSLADIPLQINFTIKIAVGDSLTVVTEKTVPVPVGMTLITGTTTGPDFKPRVEANPPDIFPLCFEIAKQNDDNGNFYILFNTTLYNKALEKNYNYAKHTGKKYNPSEMGLYIEWPKDCSVPLKYELPDSTLTSLKAGSKVTIGHHGFFDMLTPEEHELRVKKYFEKFAEDLSLNPEIKTLLFTTLDQLRFDYNYSKSPVPGFSDNMLKNPTINIPGNKNDFWGKPFDNPDNPAYTVLFHVMGHFIHQVVTLSDHRFFNFLADNCSGDNNLYKKQIEEGDNDFFNKSEYISFNEAGADFFAYLMFSFLKENVPDFADKSIYYQKGYIEKFTDFESFKEVQKKYPSWLVSGPQTAFLVNYYGAECESNPAAVYSDFLFNITMFDKLSRGTGPAYTFNRWLLTKHITFGSKSFSGNTDPDELASEYGLLNKHKRICVFPRSDFDKAQLVLDDKAISGFTQIPEVVVTSKPLITFGQGNFAVLFSSNDTLLMLEADSSSSAKVKDEQTLVLLSGTFFGDSPLKFYTRLAEFDATGNDYVVTVTPKQTFVYNQNGKLDITTGLDGKTLLGGFATTISKKGNIKKPKPPKKGVPKRFEKSIEIPFEF